MITVARDTKVQVEFNERTVKAYRLIGCKNHDIADKDFRNDRIDAGEVGSGHSVTALYEVKLVDGDVSNWQPCVCVGSSLVQMVRRLSRRSPLHPVGSVALFETPAMG